MSEILTVSQRQRLVELSAPSDYLDCIFIDKADRDAFYKEKESQLAKINKDKLLVLLNEEYRPLVNLIERDLIKWLTEKENFSQVNTPIIITQKALDKMTITAEHPLNSQVFWLEANKCLRPMLAPNLYEMMGDLHRVLRQPIKIFESGPCFRKETQGAQHMNEFTMLNLVELAGTPNGSQMERLKQLAIDAMEAMGLDNYELEITTSEVYGETLDIVANGIELASGAFGPHPLDAKWGIFEPWVGIGFGLERLAMVKGGYQTIKRVGRSLAYLDGARLNI